MNHYYFGIRRYPYCTDTNKNPLSSGISIESGERTYRRYHEKCIVGTSANEVQHGEFGASRFGGASQLITKYGYRLETTGVGNL